MGARSVSNAGKGPKERANNTVRRNFGDQCANRFEAIETTSKKDTRQHGPGTTGSAPNANAWGKNSGTVHVLPKSGSERISGANRYQGPKSFFQGPREAAKKLTACLKRIRESAVT